MFLLILDIFSNKLKIISLLIVILPSCSIFLRFSIIQEVSIKWFKRYIYFINQKFIKFTNKFTMQLQKLLHLLPPPSIEISFLLITQQGVMHLLHLHHSYYRFGALHNEVLL